MSKAETLNSLKGGLSRRSFLKTTGVVAGAAAVVGSAGALTALAEDYSSGQPEGDGEQIFCGICRGNCSGTCKLNLHVVDGKVVKTSSVRATRSEMAASTASACVA